MVTKNAQISTKPVAKAGSNVVNVDFRDRKSLPARIEKQRFNNRHLNAANDNEQDEATNPSNTNRIQEMLRRRTLARGAQTVLARKIALKGVGAGLIWIAGGISFFIAIISMISLGLFANKDSWASFFAGIFSEASFEDMAMFLSGFNIILAFAAYGGYILFFSALKSNPLKTTAGLGATIFCMALDVIPLIQIFPWLVIWIAIVAYTPIGKES